jgi:hypothetical protein
MGQKGKWNKESAHSHTRTGYFNEARRTATAGKGIAASAEVESTHSLKVTEMGPSVAYSLIKERTVKEANLFSYALYRVTSKQFSYES